MKLEQFKNKKYIANKLEKFGFKKEQNGWSYSTTIEDFRLDVRIVDNNLKTKLTETDTGEEYTLHLVEGIEGKFVGKIRKEYEKVLLNILQNCCEISIFEYEQSQMILDYVKEKYKSSPEYLWEKFPRNAICRRKDNNKWYLAILSVKASKLGFDSDDIIEVLNLKSQNVRELIKQNNVYPAYHMNKKSWISIVLDKSMGFEEICSLIDASYTLVK